MKLLRTKLAVVVGIWWRVEGGANVLVDKFLENISNKCLGVSVIKLKVSVGVNNRKRFL